MQKNILFILKFHLNFKFCWHTFFKNHIGLKLKWFKRIMSTKLNLICWIDFWTLPKMKQCFDFFPFFVSLLHIHSIYIFLFFLSFALYLFWFIFSPSIFSIFLSLYLFSLFYLSYFLSFPFSLLFFPIVLFFFCLSFALFSFFLSAFLSLLHLFLELIRENKVTFPCWWFTSQGLKIKGRGKFALKVHHRYLNK